LSNFRDPAWYHRQFVEFACYSPNVCEYFPNKKVCPVFTLARPAALFLHPKLSLLVFFATNNIDKQLIGVSVRHIRYRNAVQSTDSEVLYCDPIESSPEAYFAWSYNSWIDSDLFYIQLNDHFPSHIIKNVCVCACACFRVHIKRQQAQSINISEHPSRLTSINLNTNTTIYTLI